VKIIVPVLLLGTLVARALGASDRERAVRVDVTRDRIEFDTLGYVPLGDSVLAKGWLPYDLPRRMGNLMDSSLRCDSGRSAYLVLAPAPTVPLWLVTELLEPMSFREVKALDTVRLELPGGKVVRVHNPPPGHPGDTGRSTTGPLTLLLEDGQFSLMKNGSEEPFILVSGQVEEPPALDSLEATLAGLRAQERHRDLHVVTGNRSAMPFAAFARLAERLDHATGNGFVIDASAGRFYGLRMEARTARGQDWINWEAMKFRKSDVLDSAGTSDTGILLAGLDRLNFRRTSIMELMKWGARPRDEIMASSDGVAVVRLLPLLLTTKLPRVLQHAEEAEYPTSRDFLLPVKVPGHRLVLREVLLQHYTMKEQPCWWALYDNGRRTCIWRYSGGGGKVLPNYTLDSVLVEDGRMTVRLRGGMYRNGYSSLKGVELGFETMPGRIRLGTVRSAFTFLNDREVVRMEECAGGTCSERERQNPPERLQRSCRFVDPQSDAWTFDWKRLQREARCLTQGAGAAISHRKVTEPSFIEAGWKPDTTAH